MASVPTSRLIGPVLAGAAALLAGTVLVLPKRLLMPREAPAAAAIPPASVPPAYVPPPKETRWPQLTAKLEALREPWKGPDPASSPDTQPQQPVEQTLAWEYVGFVEGAGLRTAIVVINGTQRFITVGEHVADPSFPNNKLLVRSVDADKIEIEHLDEHRRPPSPQGEQHKPRTSTVKRKPPEPITLTPSANTPASISPGSPGTNTPPNATPGLHTGGGRGLMPTHPGNPKRNDPNNPVPGKPFQVPAAQPAPGQPTQAQPIQPAPDPKRTSAKR